jgi:hypothetical protein
MIKILQIFWAIHQSKGNKLRRLRKNWKISLKLHRKGNRVSILIWKSKETRRTLGPKMEIIQSLPKK